ncbi:MAG: N-acetylmuramoyl-L-alanine amidase, partial [Bacteroidales bacterium]|nr:N-acetylmuramoyl-L-alanine amidase [Bacteroidales bacterium]
FKDNGSFEPIEYTYDDNGNMLTDSNKSLSISKYNHLNLPEQLNLNPPQHYYEISYLYSAAGQKLHKATHIDFTPATTTDYVGSFIYQDGQSQSILTPEGRVVVDGSNYEYQYFLKDHLGNTRITFNGRRTIIQEDSYYPYGMNMAGLSHESGVDLPNKYLYNGKELQDDFGLGWYDYGARFYDAQLGRWHVPDPLQQFHSSYNYAGNNPINNIDPSGMYSYNWNTGEYNDSDGNVVSWSEVQSNNYEEPEKQKEKEKDEKEKIAIDPGHGDHNDKNSQVDPGAVNGNDYEKDIALNISEAVKIELAAKGYIIIMTRTGDVLNAGTKLQWRIDKASGAAIFVSIHTNSVSTSSANGFSVCYKSTDANSKSLAQYIQDQNTLFKNRGISERSNLYVLNKFTGTAVLVEVGFISNASDLNIMKSNTSEIGKQIATGIINYLSK